MAIDFDVKIPKNKGVRATPVEVTPVVAEPVRPAVVEPVRPEPVRPAVVEPVRQTPIVEPAIQAPIYEPARQEPTAVAEPDISVRQTPAVAAESDIPVLDAVNKSLQIRGELPSEHQVFIDLKPPNERGYRNPAYTLVSNRLRDMQEGGEKPVFRTKDTNGGMMEHELVNGQVVSKPVPGHEPKPSVTSGHLGTTWRAFNNPNLKKQTLAEERNTNTGRIEAAKAEYDRIENPTEKQKSEFIRKLRAISDDEHKAEKHENATVGSTGSSYQTPEEAKADTEAKFRVMRANDERIKDIAESIGLQKYKAPAQEEPTQPRKTEQKGTYSAREFIRDFIKHQGDNKGRLASKEVTEEQINLKNNSDSNVRLFAKNALEGSDRVLYEQYKDLLPPELKDVSRWKDIEDWSRAVNKHFRNEIESGHFLDVKNSKLVDKLVTHEMGLLSKSEEKINKAAEKDTIKGRLARQLSNLTGDARIQRELEEYREDPKAYASKKSGQINRMRQQFLLDWIGGVDDRGDYYSNGAGIFNSGAPESYITMTLLKMKNTLKNSASKIPFAYNADVFRKSVDTANEIWKDRPNTQIDPYELYIKELENDIKQPDRNIGNDVFDTSDGGRWYRFSSADEVPSSEDHSKNIARLQTISSRTGNATGTDWCTSGAGAYEVLREGRTAFWVYTSGNGEGLNGSLAFGTMNGATEFSHFDGAFNAGNSFDPAGMSSNDLKALDELRTYMQEKYPEEYEQSRGLLDRYGNADGGANDDRLHGDAAALIKAYREDSSLITYDDGTRKTLSNILNTVIEVNEDGTWNIDASESRVPLDAGGELGELYEIAFKNAENIATGDILDGATVTFPEGAKNISTGGIWADATVTFPEGAKNITTGDIRDGATVTFPEGAENITTGAIWADATVTFPESAKNITTGDIQAGATVTFPEGAENITTGAIWDGATVTFLEGAKNITTGDILDGATVTFLEGAKNITTGDILDGATVTFPESAKNITTGGIRDGATVTFLEGAKNITTGDIRDGATVTFPEGAKNISTGNIQAGATVTFPESAKNITTGDIQAGATVTFPEGAENITTGGIWAGVTVTFPEGAKNITTGAIWAGATVTFPEGAENIATGSILDGATVTFPEGAENIATGSILDGATVTFPESAKNITTGDIRDGATVTFPEGAENITTGGIRDGATVTFPEGAKNISTRGIWDGATVTFLEGAKNITTGDILDGATVTFPEGAKNISTGGIWDGATVTFLEGAKNITTGNIQADATVTFLEGAENIATGSILAGATVTFPEGAENITTGDIWAGATVTFPEGAENIATGDIWDGATVTFPEGAENITTGGIRDGATVNVISANGELTPFKRRYSKTGDSINGYVDSNKVIHISMNDAVGNTLFHERGHLWNDFVKENHPELFKKGADLIKGSEYYREVQNNPSYGHLDEDGIIDEAMARAIGDKGEQFVNASKRASFKAWLNELFNKVKNFLGIRNLSSEEVQNLTFNQYFRMAAADVIENKDFIAVDAENKNIFEENKGTELADEGEDFGTQPANIGDAHVPPELNPDSIVPIQTTADHTIKNVIDVAPLYTVNDPKMQGWVFHTADLNGQRVNYFTVPGENGKAEEAYLRLYDEQGRPIDINISGNGYGDTVDGKAIRKVSKSVSRKPVTLRTANGAEIRYTPTDDATARSLHYELFKQRESDQENRLMEALPNMSKVAKPFSNAKEFAKEQAEKLTADLVNRLKGYAQGNDIADPMFKSIYHELYVRGVPVEGELQELYEDTYNAALEQNERYAAFVDMYMSDNVKEEEVHRFIEESDAAVREQQVRTKRIAELAQQEAKKAGFTSKSVEAFRKFNTFTKAMLISSPRGRIMDLRNNMQGGLLNNATRIKELTKSVADALRKGGGDVEALRDIQQQLAVFKQLPMAERIRKFPSFVTSLTDVISESFLKGLNNTDLEAAVLRTAAPEVQEYFESVGGLPGLASAGSNVVRHLGHTRVQADISMGTVKDVKGVEQELQTLLSGGKTEYAGNQDAVIDARTRGMLRGVINEFQKKVDNGVATKRDIIILNGLRFVDLLMPFQGVINTFIMRTGEYFRLAPSASEVMRLGSEAAETSRFTGKNLAVAGARAGRIAFNVTKLGLLAFAIIYGAKGGIVISSGPDDEKHKDVPKGAYTYDPLGGLRPLRYDNPVWEFTQLLIGGAVSCMAGNNDWASYFDEVLHIPAEFGAGEKVFSNVINVLTGKNGGAAGALADIVSGPITSALSPTIVKDVMKSADNTQYTKSGNAFRDKLEQMYHIGGMLGLNPEYKVEHNDKTNETTANELTQGTSPLSWLFGDVSPKVGAEATFDKVLESNPQRAEEVAAKEINDAVGSEGVADKLKYDDAVIKDPDRFLPEKSKGDSGKAEELKKKAEEDKNVLSAINTFAQYSGLDADKINSYQDKYDETSKKWNSLTKKMVDDPELLKTYGDMASAVKQVSPDMVDKSFPDMVSSVSTVTKLDPKEYAAATRATMNTLKILGKETNTDEFNKILSDYKRVTNTVYWKGFDKKTGQFADDAKCKALGGITAAERRELGILDDQLAKDNSLFGEALDDSINQSIETRKYTPPSTGSGGGGGGGGGGFYWNTYNPSTSDVTYTPQYQWSFGKPLEFDYNPRIVEGWER